MIESPIGDFSICWVATEMTPEKEALSRSTPDSLITPVTIVQSPI